MADLIESFSTIQKVFIHAQTVDGNKHPVLLPAAQKLDWNVAPIGIVTLFPSTDGSSCEVNAIAAGTTTITVSGPGLTSATVAVTITAAPAVAIVLTADAPILQ